MKLLKKKMLYFTLDTEEMPFLLSNFKHPSQTQFYNSAQYSKYLIFFKIAILLSSTPTNHTWVKRFNIQHSEITACHR